VAIVISNAIQRLIPTSKGALLALLLSFFWVHVALADDWSLKDKDGINYKLSDEKGKWVLVNFWAPWCPECLQEMSGFNAVQKQHPDLLIIGVAVMYKKKQEVTDAIQAQSVTYPIVLGDEDIASDFGEMKGMPTSFLYSPSGKLVGHHDGYLSQEEIEQAIGQKPGSAETFTR
jgi:thiol-disulfide isomerase/thioredoxin